MVAFPSLVLFLWLLVGNKNGSNNTPRRSRRSHPSDDSVQTDAPKSGRHRYGRTGQKHTATGAGPNSRRNRSDNNPRGRPEEREVDHIQLPQPTTPNGPRPSFFSCRHTYEHILIQEIQETLPDVCKDLQLTSPGPGLVECLPFKSEGQCGLPTLHDPVYALQALPECVVVSAESIKGLSRAVQEALLGGSEDTDDSRCHMIRERLREAPRASLAIHGLVPGMFKGQPTPVMGNRVEKVIESVSKELKRGYAAARAQRREDGNSDTDDSPERWLLQVLLLAPNLAAASLVQCQPLGLGSDLLENQTWSPTHFWPNWHLPAGMAKVDITERTMPSSAYRKLMEALECLRVRPDPSTTSFVVDLGACPGGWTSVLCCNLDCKVLAVDRSPLDQSLMDDRKVEFIQGDAFAFEPPVVADISKEVWMVSDVIAYPERVAELLKRWCAGRWATHMIVTMKFQGKEPSFGALQESIVLAKRHGYDCRAKHFFNNKNEVTLMLVQRPEGEEFAASYPLQPGVLGTPMYNALLPTL